MIQTSEATAEHHAAAPGHEARYQRPVGVPNDPRQKSPFLAGLLSVVPGLGQVYVGYYQRGFIHALVVASLITVMAAEIEALMPLTAVFMAFFWLYNVIDAARRAALYNQALAGLGEVELPEDFKMPGFRGSIVGGVLVIALGFLFLLNNLGVSLEWLEDWWPLAVIGFGVYLVWKGWQDRQRAESPPTE